MQRANGLMGGSCLQMWLWTGSALSSCSGEVIQSGGFLNPCKAAGFQAPTPHPSLNHPISILLLCYFVFAMFCFLLCRICLCSDFLMNRGEEIVFVCFEWGWRTTCQAFSKKPCEGSTIFKLQIQKAASMTHTTSVTQNLCIHSLDSVASCDVTTEAL